MLITLSLSKLNLKVCLHNRRSQSLFSNHIKRTNYGSMTVIYIYNECSNRFVGLEWLEVF